MHVEVRLFAYLREGRFKNRQMDLPEGTALGDVLRQLEIPVQQVSLPLVNGRYSPLDHKLADDDILSIFPPVAGG